MLWTHSQGPADDVHVGADVQALDVDRPRGGREQASQYGPDKHEVQWIKDDGPI